MFKLVIADIQTATDLFRPLYEESDGRYGYVCLEVNPHLANDTEGTVEEARHMPEEGNHWRLTGAGFESARAHVEGGGQGEEPA